MVMLNIDAQSPPRLLVLDDDEQVTSTICAIAESSGIESLATINAQDFLGLVATWKPTHLVIDLAMPNADGVEILRVLTERHCQARIIIASGLGRRVLDAAQRIAKENGLQVAGILPKPFSPRELRQLLEVQTPQSSPQKLQPTTPDMSEQITAQMIDTAVSEGQLAVFYQPKLSTADNSVWGFEALVRWIHPQHGMISPELFIPVAEQSSTIVEITNFVFAQALNFMSRLPTEMNLHIAVNFSPCALGDPQLPELMLSQCTRYRVCPERVTIEITETSSMDNPLLMLEHLTKFRIHGFGVSIDDFGVGHSSLVHLARLPFSEIKIDRAFLMSAERSQESQQIAKTIVQLGNTFGIPVTGEGVESQWIMDFLRRIGCHYAQGYSIARPMPEEDTILWLMRQGPRSELVACRSED